MISLDDLELSDMDVVLNCCVPLDKALTAFTGPHEEDEGTIYPVCCGKRALCMGGLFHGRIECDVCGAEALDMLAPMDSIVLARGNSYISTPSDALIDRLGRSHWLVVQDGDR